MTEHDCKFPEVEIEEVDETEGSYLKAGMKLLAPCPECGETPYESAQVMQAHIEELTEALCKVEPFRPLYHWSPAARRKQINRYGLRPSMRSTTSTEGYKAPYICFADTPSWAWALSGDMPDAIKGEWDLWMTYLDKLQRVTILPTTTRPSSIYELRAEQRVYKSQLWYVGSRIKE